MKHLILAYIVFVFQEPDSLDLRMEGRDPVLEDEDGERDTLR
jgi:hypothetical protein